MLFRANLSSRTNIMRSCEVFLARLIYYMLQESVTNKRVRRELFVQGVQLEFRLISDVQQVSHKGVN